MAPKSKPSDKDRASDTEAKPTATGRKTGQGPRGSVVSAAGKKKEIKDIKVEDIKVAMKDNMVKKPTAKQGIKKRQTPTTKITPKSEKQIALEEKLKVITERRDHLYKKLLSLKNWKVPTLSRLCNSFHLLTSFLSLACFTGGVAACVFDMLYGEKSWTYIVILMLLSSVFAHQVKLYFKSRRRDRRIDFRWHRNNLLGNSRTYIFLSMAFFIQTLTMVLRALSVTVWTDLTTLFTTAQVVLFICATCCYGGLFITYLLCASIHKRCGNLSCPCTCTTMMDKAVVRA
eukprot:GILK01005401.1.p1 GENE.GILK01005401.1~~GILK01005401.1.p1  ORF type:complete len:298 (+),score=46.84 GILK01005401.1:34-894(+)